ncbi:MAG: hypothetical protein ACYCOU_12795 [Sulfobacillus sp.]
MFITKSDRIFVYSLKFRGIFFPRADWSPIEVLERVMHELRFFPNVMDFRRVGAEVRGPQVATYEVSLLTFAPVDLALLKQSIHRRLELLGAGDSDLGSEPLSRWKSLRKLLGAKGLARGSVTCVFVKSYPADELALRFVDLSTAEHEPAPDSCASVCPAFFMDAVGLYRGCYVCIPPRDAGSIDRSWHAASLQHKSLEARKFVLAKLKDGERPSYADLCLKQTEARVHVLGFGW